LPPKKSLKLSAVRRSRTAENRNGSTGSPQEEPGEKHRANHILNFGLKQFAERIVRPNILLRKMF